MGGRPATGRRAWRLRRPRRLRPLLRWQGSYLPGETAAGGSHTWTAGNAMAHATEES